MPNKSQSKKIGTRKVSKTSVSRQKRENAMPRGGKARRDLVGRSGAGRASGPLSPSATPLQPMGSVTPGTRGAQGDHDPGDSEIFFVGAELITKDQVNASAPGEPPARKMRKREIPRQEWLDFFDRFSEQHQDSLATLYVIDGDHQRLILAQDLPLHAATASLEHSDHDTISISFANTRTMMLAHNQSNVEHVSLLQNPEGAPAGLLLEGYQQERTLLLFHSPKLPQMGDGT